MNTLRKLSVVIVAIGSVSALALLPALAVAKSKLADLECGPNEIAKSDGTNWFCADDLNELSQAIEEIGELGCSATQQDNSVLITCGDGTSGVIAGAGTVVMYPEGQIGQVPPIDYNTGPIVVVDGSGVVLGEASWFSDDNYFDYFDVFLAENDWNLQARLVNVHSTQQVAFLPAATGLYFLSDDCSGPAFSYDSIGPWSIDNQLFTLGPEPSERLLFGSFQTTERWDLVGEEIQYTAPQECETHSTISSARPLVEYFLAPEIANAVYPLRVEQLP